VQGPAAEIVFDRVTKRYPGRPGAAVSELSLTVAPGELCVLVGPSGGGKTTALKMVNRLVSIDEGEIRIDGRSVDAIPVTELRRGIGYVIQQVGLFPHMTVADNVGAVPRLLGWPRERVRERVRELLELIGLDPDADGRRYPAALSGGQRQRVGLARALAADPPILLMDEPFGAVDPIVRAHLQQELRRLHHEVGKTILFVTHDVDEAISLGDRIAVFRQGGVLAQVDTPDRLLAEPADDFVRRFLGEDRELRRLALRRVGELELEARGTRDGLPSAPEGISVRTAVSLMLGAGADALVVVGADGAELGVLRLARVQELLA
jgi:osmoprotectant transport system ATP-binding protein